MPPLLDGNSHWPASRVGVSRASRTRAPGVYQLESKLLQTGLYRGLYRRGLTKGDARTLDHGSYVGL